MTDIQPGDHIIVTAKVLRVIEVGGKQRVKVDTEELDWIDSDRCMIIGREA